MKNKGSSMKKKAYLTLAAVALLWLGWGLVLPNYPADGTVVSVPIGVGVKVTARDLKKAGAIRSAFLFQWMARLSGNSGEIKAGDYAIPSGMNAFETLGLLVSGKSLQHTLLVKEGMSAAQIGAAIEKLGLGSASKFMAVVRDPAEVDNLKVPGPTLEGYLFPDSYFLPKGMAEEAIAAQMVARFHQVVPDDLLAQGAAIRLNPRQIMAMAALIEKEAKADTERPMVSAVFRNRMRLKKRLESCASVRYALGKWTGPLYNKDLLAKSPYNTYQNYGLPPGPICNPGLKSIQAALHPAETKDLFFVVDGQGTQHFSETYEDFLKAKQHYKRLRRGVVEE
jgi:UPF0755 protein